MIIQIYSAGNNIYTFKYLGMKGLITSFYVVVLFFNVIMKLRYLFCMIQVFFLILESYTCKCIGSENPGGP